MCVILMIWFLSLQVNEVLKVNGKHPNALSMLGDLELKNDDWVKAKETFRAASDATDGKDSYSTLSLVRILFSGIILFLLTCLDIIA